MSATKPIIITAGKKYQDIDALACAIAYKELLSLKNTLARVVLEGKLNESVTATIKNWGFSIERSLKPSPPTTCSYVLVDISEPDHFAKFVVPENIIEIYDHRHGFEDYWKEKLGEKSHIELVGACATLIWEEFKRAGLENKIDTVSANLLYTAILSNTLNLQAQITSTRDGSAIDELAKHTNLPKDWRQIYFDEVAKGIMADPVGSMVNDTKVLDINGEQYIITQLELWDSKKFIDAYFDVVVKTINDRNIANTFLTCPNISQGYNYLVATNDVIKDKLTAALEAEWSENIGKTKRLWLRKEIIPLL